MRFFFVVFVILIIMLIAKILVDRKFFLKERRMLKKDLERSQWLLKVTNELLCLLISQKHWYQYLHERGYASVAIYGMGELGIRLSEDIILNDSIKLLYGMDINARAISFVVPVYTLNEVRSLPKPDVVVLTTYCIDDNLKSLIENETGCEVLYIEEIMNAIR